jgi:hypothetical protein
MLRMCWAPLLLLYVLMMWTWKSLPLHLFVWNWIHGIPSLVISEQDESFPHPHILFFYIDVKVILPFVLGFSRWSFPSGISTKSLYAFGFLSIQTTCPTHLILSDLLPKYLVRRTNNEAYYSVFCSLLLLLPSLLGANILCSTLFS